MELISKDRESLFSVKKEQARAKMRSLAKILMKKYKFPIEGQEVAWNIVLAQCKMWTDNEVSDVA